MHNIHTHHIKGTVVTYRGNDGQTNTHTFEGRLMDKTEVKTALVSELHVQHGAFISLEHV